MRHILEAHPLASTSLIFFPNKGERCLSDSGGRNCNGDRQRPSWSYESSVTFRIKKEKRDEAMVGYFALSQ